MGQRKLGGITKEHAMNQLIIEECNRNDLISRKRDLEDAKELMEYQTQSMNNTQGQPLVVFGTNLNVNININVDSNMDAYRLQELLDVVSGMKI